MSLAVVPATPADLHAIEVRPEIATPIPPGWTEDNPTACELLERYARCMVEDGRPLGVVGVLPKWPGVATAWTMLGVELVRDHAIAMTRITAALLLEAQAELSLHRVEAVTLCDFPAGHRWLVALRFHQESARMQAYGPDGSDYSLYARTLWT